MVVFDRVAGPHHAAPFPAPGWSPAARAARPPAARSRCRSDRPSCRRGPRARGRSGARRARRSGRSCPRSTGNSAGRGSAICPEYIGERCTFARMIVVRGVGRAGDAALDLRRLDALGEHRERLRRLVAGLHLDRGPVDRRAVEPRRRAGLQPAEREAEPLERARKPDGGRLADPAGRRLLLADMDQAAQERAGGQHHGAAGKFAAVGQRERPVTRPSAISRSSASPSITVRFAVSRIAACIAAA